MRRSAFPFSEGLQDWARGIDSDEAEAAGINLAETLIFFDRWVRSHFDKDKR